MSWSRAIDCSDEVALPARTGEQDPPLWRLLGQICRALKRDDPIAHRYLLLLRFIPGQRYRARPGRRRGGPGLDRCAAGRRRGRAGTCDRSGIPRGAGVERATGGPAQPRPERARAVRQGAGGPGARLSRSHCRTRRREPDAARLESAPEARGPDAGKAQVLGLTNSKRWGLPMPGAKIHLLEGQYSEARLFAMFDG